LNEEIETTIRGIARWIHLNVIIEDSNNNECIVEQVIGEMIEELEK